MSLLQLNESVPELSIEVGLGKRFLNFIIDLVFVRILSVIAAIPIALVIFSLAPDRPRRELFIILDYLLWLGTYLLYYLMMESTFQRTVAKWVTGTKVVSAEGGKPSFRQILIRTVVRIVPFDGLSFAIADRGWHDSWSGTKVIDSRVIS